MRLHWKFRVSWKWLLYSAFLALVYTTCIISFRIAGLQKKEFERIFDGESPTIRLKTRRGSAVKPNPFNSGENGHPKMPNEVTAVSTVSLSTTTLSATDRFFRRQLKIVNHFNSSVKINPLTTCEDSNLFLLVFVLSNPRNDESRNAIRETWGRSEKTAKVIFLLGYDTDKYIAEKVKNESDLHRDLVQYDVPENYENLVTKSVMGLQWATLFCRHAQFVLKTDDDILLHIPHITNILSNLNETTNVVTGACIAESNVYRTGKWKLAKKQYPFKKYPVYCSGSSYILSMDAAVRIYETAKYVPTVPIEDVYVTGIVSRVAGLSPKGLPGFPLWTTRYRIPCPLKSGKLHGVHGLSPAKMRDVWGRIQKKSIC